MQSARSSESSAYSHRAVESNFAGSNERWGEESQNDHPDLDETDAITALLPFSHFEAFRTDFYRQKTTNQIPLSFKNINFNCTSPEKFSQKFTSDDLFGCLRQATFTPTSWLTITPFASLKRNDRSEKGI